MLYILWAGLYVLCAGLGCIHGATGLGKAMLVAAALLFFVPGFLLLYDGRRRGDRKQLRRIFWIAVTSLSLTVVFLIANFLTLGASVATGNLLYALLMLVSTPMICGQYWAVSLFLWAFLLIGAAFSGKK